MRIGRAHSNLMNILYIGKGARATSTWKCSQWLGNKYTESSRDKNSSVSTWCPENWTRDKRKRNWAGSKNQSTAGMNPLLRKCSRNPIHINPKPPKNDYKGYQCLESSMSKLDCLRLFQQCKRKLSTFVAWIVYVFEAHFCKICALSLKVKACWKWANIIWYIILSGEYRQNRKFAFASRLFSIFLAKLRKHTIFLE